MKPHPAETHLNLNSLGSVRTRHLGLEHPGRETGAAETHSVQSQNAEGVVDVGRQFEVNRRLGPGDLGEVVPVAAMVQRVLILDQKFCRKHRKMQVYYTNPPPGDLIWTAVILPFAA